MEIKEFILLSNPRLFKLGNRIKIFYANKWWSGVVEYFAPWRWCNPKCIFDLVRENNKYELIEENIETGKVTYDDYNHAYMYIRTDEKVGENVDIFKGYGLRSSSDGKDIIFENEKEYIPKPFFIETEKEDISFENLPF